MKKIFFFFAPCPRKIHYFDAKLYKIEAKKIFFQNDQKKFWIGAKMLGRSVNSKPKYF